MSEVRFARLERDGTVIVFLSAEEASFYEGPKASKRSTDARFRCQVVSVDDLDAERAGIAETLPWFRHVDRKRAIQDLHRTGANRSILEHVASTAVASFPPALWNTINVVRGRWETDLPFRTDVLCKSGGAVFDAALPIGIADLEAEIRSIPKDDVRRRERAAILVSQHDEGLPSD
jgi:hypothetical protein